jgi:hypothetical protein
MKFLKTERPLFCLAILTELLDDSEDIHDRVVRGLHAHIEVPKERVCQLLFQGYLRETTFHLRH